MSYKTASGGYFLIPAGPAEGTTVTTGGTAHTYGSWTEMVASAGADLFIVAVTLQPGSAPESYYQVDIGVGASSFEASIGEVKLGWGTGSLSTTPAYIPLPFPIPVASGARISCRSASKTTSNALKVTLVCINQTDLVPMDGLADAVLDEVVEGSYTLRHLVRLMAAALLGKLSGAATTTITIRDASDTKTRITATVDEDGNRSALTLDET